MNNKSVDDKENKGIDCIFSYDKIISIISVISIAVFWVLLVPISGYLTRLSYAIMHTSYVISGMILLIYFSLFIVKSANKLLKNPLKVKFTTSLYTDFTIILFETMILLSSGGFFRFYHM